MAKRDRFTCRFVVGRPGAPQSTVWRAWAGHTHPDFYIAARAVAGLSKVSLHATGEGQISLTSEYAKTLMDVGQLSSNAQRHAVRWNGGADIGLGCTHEFQISIPTDQLRRSPEVVDESVTWIDPAPAGQMTQVNIAFGKDVKFVGFPGMLFGNQLVGEGKLSDGTCVWVTSRHVDMNEFNSSAQKHMARIAADMEAKRQSATEFQRIIAMYRDDLGVHGIAEFAADGLKAIG